MNILKPQNLHIQELENKCLIDLDEDEKINYCNFENEEYSSSQLKDDYLEALNKLQADPIKVKILRGNDYTARAKIMLDIKNSCIEKYKLFFN